MPRYKDEAPMVHVYTVCDESKLVAEIPFLVCFWFQGMSIVFMACGSVRYLIVRNVPALGCQGELQELFASYGEIDECKPMDAEDCEEFTDVYWIKFHLICNARFAKRKLDEHVFLGNRLQVSYAPNYESISDTKEKLESRRNEVLARLKTGRSKGSKVSHQGSSSNSLWDPEAYNLTTRVHQSSISRVSSHEDYFPSHSMNQTVRMVRDKLNKIESSALGVQPGPAMKKPRVDNRRRI